MSKSFLIPVRLSLPVRLIPTSSEIQTRSYPNSFGRQAGTTGYEFIEAMDLVGHGARIAEEAVQLLAAPQCPSGIMTVILDGPQVAFRSMNRVGIRSSWIVCLAMRQVLWAKAF